MASSLGKRSLRTVGAAGVGAAVDAVGAARADGLEGGRGRGPKKGRGDLSLDYY